MQRISDESIKYLLEPERKFERGSVFAKAILDLQDARAELAIRDKECETYLSAGIQLDSELEKARAELTNANNRVAELEAKIATKPRIFGLPFDPPTTY